METRKAARSKIAARSPPPALHYAFHDSKLVSSEHSLRASTSKPTYLHFIAHNSKAGYQHVVDRRLSIKLCTSFIKVIMLCKSLISRLSLYKICFISTDYRAQFRKFAVLLGSNQICQLVRNLQTQN